MSDTSARLALPLIDPGQAQKDLTHNEALLALDMAVQAGVAALDVDDPPSTPVAGEAWIVGAAPTGAWSGHAGEIAGWTVGGWRFLTPREGFEVWCEASGTAVRRRGGVWEEGIIRGAALVIGGVGVVGDRRSAIADPSGGTTVDAKARAAIGQVLDALRGHGLIAS